MKAIVDTISVNPGKTTLGQTGERERALLRANILNENYGTQSRIDFVSLFFPSASCGISAFRKYALPLRTLFATILIVSGLNLLQAPGAIYSTGQGIAMITAGGMLALGLLARPVMALAAAFFAVVGAISIRIGAPEMNLFSLMFGSLLFAFTGSGKYSCDEMIFRALRRHEKKSKKNLCDRRLSYRAFHMATKSL